MKNSKNILISKDDMSKWRKTSYVKNESDVNSYFSGKNRSTIKMGERIILKDPSLFFKWMDYLAEKPVGSPDRNRYYFRGERSAEYQLIPSLLSNNKFEYFKDRHLASTPLELQKKLLDRYKRYTQHLIHADHDFDAPIDDFDTLCLAQHYGLPTLLLDWTLNPFVASFFAASGVSRTLLQEKLTRDKDITKYWIRVWVMRLKSPSKREHQTIHLEDRSSSQIFHRDIGRTGMTPDGPRIVVPMVFTRRIASQVGRFIYCGYMTDSYTKGRVPSLASFSANNPIQKVPWNRLYSLDIEFSVKSKKKMKIDKKKHLIQTSIDQFMYNLEFKGFHAGRLFPDLDGWAQYLADGNL